MDRYKQCEYCGRSLFLSGVAPDGIEEWSHVDSLSEIDDCPNVL